MKNDKNTTTPLDVGIAVAAAVAAVDNLPDGVREKYLSARRALGEAFVVVTHLMLDAPPDAAEDADIHSRFCGPTCPKHTGGPCDLELWKER